MRRTHQILFAVAGTALLAGVLLTVLLREDTTLENSLVDLSVLPAVHRGEVRSAFGVPLSGTLTSRTLTARESPYLLTGTVMIPRGVTLRVEPGTTIEARESARLVVEGAFEATRTTFLSHQLHPMHRLWHGLTVQNGGKLHLTESAVVNTSAAIVCGAQGSAVVRGGVLSQTAAGIVSLPDTAACVAEDLSVADAQVGFFLLGGRPRLRGVTMTRVADGVRVFHDARPVLERITMEPPRHSAIVYQGVPDLLVRGLALPEGADLNALILDGADIPTHRWNGEEYRTGVVRVQ